MVKRRFALPVDTVNFCAAQRLGAEPPRSHGHRLELAANTAESTALEGHPVTQGLVGDPTEQAPDVDGVMGGDGVMSGLPVGRYTKGFASDSFRMLPQPQAPVG